MSDYQKNMTLDEIRENHSAMFAELSKRLKHYNFGGNMDSCLKFMGMCMDKALKHLGVYVPKIKTSSRVAARIHENKIQRALDRNKVKVERHNRMHEGEDVWMNGMYIYKDDVLVYFISEPMTVTPSQFAVNREKSFGVITNVKT